MELSQPAKSFRIKVYSRAYQRLVSEELGSPLPAGGSKLSFRVDGLANGLYFVNVEAESAEGKQLSELCKLLVLR